MNATIRLRIEIKSYIRASGEVPFESWFEILQPAAAAKVGTALTRLELGNMSNDSGEVFLNIKFTGVQVYESILAKMEMN